MCSLIPSPTAGANADRMDVSAFLPGGTFLATSVEYNGTTDVDITNKIVKLVDANGGVDDVNTVAEVLADINGIATAAHIQNNGKAVLFAGDDSAGAATTMYFIDDSLDGTAGTLSATDVVAVGTFTAFNLGGLAGGHFMT